MKMLKTAIGGAVLLLVVMLAIANRATTSLSLDPFNPDNPAITVAMPLFLLLFGVFTAGLALGAIAGWASQGQNRKTARATRKLERAQVRQEQVQDRAKKQTGNDQRPNATATDITTSAH